MNKDEALKLLEASGIFFDIDCEVGEHTINLNDVFGWACADMEKVEEPELITVANLFYKYGWCGVLYWVSEKRGGERSEFLDNNRFIDFVKNEEKLIKQEPDTDKRAYLKYSYKLGGV
jgi:hypothetical protein